MLTNLACGYIYISPTHAIGIHPSKTTRIRDGVTEQMDIFEYLFVHAQRLPDKRLLRPINKHKYTSRSRHDTVENTKQSRMDELKEEEGIEENVRQGKRKLFQRGLGLLW